MKQPNIAKPPKWATWLLHFLCADHLIEEMDGDLEELFYQRVKSVGLQKARFRYVIDALSLLRPLTFKKRKSAYPESTYNQPAMIRNNFKIAFRNLWKHKVFTFINVMGLTVGMTACFLIALYVHFELSYDSFNKKANRIFNEPC